MKAWIRKGTIDDFKALRNRTATEQFTQRQQELMPVLFLEGNGKRLSFDLTTREKWQKAKKIIEKENDMKGD